MFNKKSVYHSELASAGKLDVLVVEDPRKSKFKGKDGEDRFYWTFKLQGKEHDYLIENDAIHKKLFGYKGHVIEITATGSREEADIEIYDAAGPGSQQASNSRAEQPPSRGPNSTGHVGHRDNPPPTEDLKGVKTYLLKAINARILCQEAATTFAKEWEQRHGEPIEAETVDSIATGFYIDLQRKGMVDALPWKLIPPKGDTPPKPPPPPQRTDDPGDDEIPW